MMFISVAEYEALSVALPPERGLIKGYPGSHVVSL
ncbi:hypothetical protein EM595_p0399 (plasmid) [Duffyella gerundensis]|uniref:Uncharacterized protein n=1 Tax=Duffyella gerundensis TaxID=1619313 RepID=A0A0U5LAH8_9GAMM|nr:hypothetical protein EM595_p0399 [Duffyella gerundensis]